MRGFLFCLNPDVQTNERSTSAMSIEQTVRQFLEGESSPEQKAHFCLSAGQRMEKSGDYAAAAACYSLAFRLAPEKSDVWYFLHNNVAYCLNQIGNYEAAEVYCRAAIDINPGRHNAYKNLAIALQGQEQYVEAAGLFLQAVRLQPGDSRALWHLESLMDAHRVEITAAIPDIRQQIAECRELVENITRAKAGRTPTTQELKLTAALYAQHPGVLDHLQTTGRLPDTVDNGGANVALRRLIETRGTDIVLKPDEQLVYDAIIRERRLPGGSVILAPSSNQEGGYEA
jgi:tetratricopeptide (TPR) repeat protein